MRRSVPCLSKNNSFGKLMNNNTNYNNNNNNNNNNLYEMNFLKK